jgi:hypothetical protein
MHHEALQIRGICSNMDYTQHFRTQPSSRPMDRASHDWNDQPRQRIRSYDRLARWILSISAALAILTICILIYVRLSSVPIVPHGTLPSPFPTSLASPIVTTRTMTLVFLPLPTPPKLAKLVTTTVVFDRYYDRKKGVTRMVYDGSHWTGAERVTAKAVIVRAQ